jgi:hypothetical protein
VRQGLILALLILSGLAIGCISKPQESPAPTAPAEDETSGEVGDEIPDVAEVTEDELTPEPDLSINDTVDLGSLL